jgi:hypothetical protein
MMFGPYFSILFDIQGLRALWCAFELILDGRFFEREPQIPGKIAA